jgi:hypothetical protein
MSKGKGKDKKTGKSYSGINAHKRQKKTLVPPLMAIPGINLQSWVNDRLPEMLWAALLISRLGREPALSKFRTLASLIPKLPIAEQKVEPTLTGLGRLEPDLLLRFLRNICSDNKAKDALRPLLLFEGLPAKSAWTATIGQVPTHADWNNVKDAVLITLNHQSQEATDCRWVRVLFRVLSGTLHLGSTETVREILDYPTFGIPQKVRPTVRSMEGALNQLENMQSTWSQSFWAQSFRDTPCEPGHTMETGWMPRVTTTAARVREVREALARHARVSQKTTGVDAKHDGAFGFAAYALAILDELLWMENSISIIGRLSLRTLLELYITLSYLKLRDDPDLWMAYRQYGSGQAKLAFLKLEDSAKGPPSSINQAVLDQLANEDRWLEFVQIDLGHWADLDLRKLSEEVGLKPEYDRFYSWTSAFTHGNWAATRNSCFDLCMNPVHRLHRVLRPDTADLGDVVPDACELVDRILSVIDSLYPGFVEKVTAPEPKIEVGSIEGLSDAQERSSPFLLAPIQREYFQILDEFFRRATDRSAQDFASIDSFDQRVEEESRQLGARAGQAYLYAHGTLSAFYKKYASHIFARARKLPGLKYVLGGSSQFAESQFESVRKMLLYANSTLIPDPILPWVESPRIEERFRLYRFLESAFFLLHLKPLVDADLSSPPIVVFPSFEKTLEERDTFTQEQIFSLVTRIVSHFLNRPFETLDDLQKYATTNETEFLKGVDERNLFVAPGGKVGQPLLEALEQYASETSQWRSQSYQAVAEGLPKGLLVLNAIIERIGPQYHLLENARELSSCPMIPLNAPWHYYSLISKYFADRLQAKGYLDAHAIDSQSILNEPQKEWLGNIPIRELIEMTSRRENEGFHVHMGELVSELYSAPLTDLGRLVPEICRKIAHLLGENHSEIQIIKEKYKSRYSAQSVDRYVTPGPNFRLTPAPALQLPTRQGGAAVTVEGESKLELDEKKATRSLIGVLSVADAG